jgi:hypothetical protein
MFLAEEVGNCKKPTISTSPQAWHNARPLVFAVVVIENDNTTINQDPLCITEKQ